MRGTFHEVRSPRVRTPRCAELPTISLVVASNGSRAMLEKCLGSLLPQCARLGAELLVVRAGTSAEAVALERAFPQARIVAAPCDATVRQLRSIGMAEATGDIVVLTEDDTVDVWLPALLPQYAFPAQRTDGLSGAPPERASIDWDAYFVSRGLFAPWAEAAPVPPTPRGTDTGGHRSIVHAVVEWACPDEWAWAAHRQLLARGCLLDLPEAARASSRGHEPGFVAWCADRFRGGQQYAQQRCSMAPAVTRVLFALTALFLPPVLTWHIARAALPASVTTRLRTLPAVFALVTAWSCGEALGYLRGIPDLVPAS